MSGMATTQDLKNTFKYLLTRKILQHYILSFTQMKDVTTMDSRTY